MADRTIDETTLPLLPVMRGAEIRAVVPHQGKAVRLADDGTVPDVEVELDGDQTPGTGIGAEFDVVWTTGATIARFSWSLGSYEEELVISPDSVVMDRFATGLPVLRDHVAMTGAIVGTTIAGTEKLEGSVGSVRVRMSTREDVAALVADVEAGIIRNVSVGYNVLEAMLIERDGQVPLLRVTKHEPLEISLVAVPADAGATVLQRDGYAASAAHIVRVRSTATPTAQADMTRKDTMTPEQIAAMRAEAATAERSRASEIRSIATKLGMADAATALVESGATVDAARAALVDAVAERQATTATLPATVAGGQDADETRAASMVSAIASRMGEKVELDGLAREFRGMSLVEQARSFLVSNGVRGARAMSASEVAQATFIGSASRAFQATGDFPALVSSAIGRTLRAAYQTSPRTFAPIVRETEIPDFKAVSRVAMSGMPQLVLVPEGTLIPQGNMSSAAETYKLGTYARVLRFTREVLVNDDLGALMRDAQATGAAAARTESDLVWGILTANPMMADGNALFSVAHANVGNADVPSVAEMGQMERLLLEQTAPNGDKLNLRLACIAVGTAYNVLGRQVTGSVTPNAPAGFNPYSGTGLIIEPRIVGTEWFGFADTNQVDIIELAYLAGAKGIQSYTAPQAADFMGTEIRVSLDVAAKAIDWRGMVSNVGA